MPWVSSMKGSAFHVPRFIACSRAMTCATTGISCKRQSRVPPPAWRLGLPASFRSMFLPMVRLHLLDKISTGISLELVRIHAAVSSSGNQPAERGVGRTRGQGVRWPVVYRCAEAAMEPGLLPVRLCQNRTSMSRNVSSDTGGAQWRERFAGVRSQPAVRHPAPTVIAPAAAAQIQRSTGPRLCALQKTSGGWGKCGR